MKFICQSTNKSPERTENVRIMQSALRSPLHVHINDSLNSLEHFVQIMEENIGNDILLLEDDAKLCNDFENIITDFISKNSEHVIRFFEQNRYNRPTEFVAGSTFICNLCVYLPRWILPELVKNLPEYRAKYPQHPTAQDYLIRFVLVKLKKKYIVHRPSLVQHLGMVSVINPRRSKHRTGKNFIDDIKQEKEQQAHD